MRIYDTAKFIEISNRIHNFKFGYIKSTYVNNSTTICVTCPIHGDMWVYPSNHMKGHDCLECSKNNRPRKSVEDFIAFCNSLYDNFYDYSRVSETYTIIKNKVCVICPIHGEFWITADSHKHRHGCAKCSFEHNGKLLLKTLNEFINEANKIHNFRYIYTNSIYLGDKTNIEIICKNHGSFWQAPNNHLTGGNCPKCGREAASEKLRGDITDIINRANIMHNFIYSYHLITEYKSFRQKVSIICPEHGIFKQSMGSHLSGSGCPYCKLSSGELLIRSYLISNNINFKHQLWFEDCKNINKLPFDFGIRNKSKKLLALIEFQGGQHYKSVEMFGGERAFEKRQKNDKIKLNYCTNNKILLLCIPYWEQKNINQILEEFIATLKIT